MAFASLFVPNFKIQAAVRAEPELRGHALALVEGNPPLSRVVAINEKAAATGIECGMTKAAAAQFAGVSIQPRSLAQEKAAHAALLDIGWSVSPRIEDTAEDTIVLDLSGLSHLFRSDEEIGRRLLQNSAECGLSPNVAIASNLETAVIAARGFSGITVIPAGQEAEYLSLLPVSVLSLPEEIAETLNRWGVNTCGAFGALPLLELSERLGQEGVRLHQLARGTRSRSLLVAEEKTSFREEMELDDAVDDLDQLSFVLGRLLEALCARLQARSLATAAIAVRFELQPCFEKAADRRKEMVREKAAPGFYETTLKLPAPMRDSKVLLKLLRLRLQSVPPAAPIEKIVLLAEADRPRSLQMGLFLPRFPEPEKLELTIARIANIVGQENVGWPARIDSHCPDGFFMQRAFSPVQAKEPQEDTRSSQRAANESAIPVAFRVCRPPVPARVKFLDGRPTHVCFQNRQGKVLAASGPWHTSGNWWRDDLWQQEEWDLEIDLGASTAHVSASAPPHRGLYRVYYDVLRQSWFVRGSYD